MSSSDVVALVGDVVWPIVVVGVLVVLRKEIVQFARVVRERAADRGTDVKLTREGLELHTRVVALEGSAETQEQAANVLSRAVALPAGGTGAESKAALPAALVELHDAYAAVDEPDRAKRTRLKTELAHSMGAIALTHRVDRTLLADQDDEIYSLALAALVSAAPEPGDAALLLRAGEGVERLHVRYQTALAFGRLAEARELSPQLVDAVRALLRSYRRGADESLLRRITRTLAQLDEARWVA